MKPGFIAAALVTVGASAADRDLYGRTITAGEILTGGRVATPPATQPFVAALK